MEDNRNWAEHDERMMNNPTLDECRAMGRSHAGCNWSSRPWGHWSPDKVAAYMEGYKGKVETGG